MPTQNLYPNAAGDLTQFPTIVNPVSSNHFEAVDETSADDDTSYVQTNQEEASVQKILIKENSTTTGASKTFTDNNPINQTDLFNIEDWPHNSGDTINSVTVTARWKNTVGGAHAQRLRLTQIFATVDYTAFVETTGPFKIEAGAKVKIESGKLTIK
mgnify:CR=1 FL=1